MHLCAFALAGLLGINPTGTPPGEAISCVSAVSLTAAETATRRCGRGVACVIAVDPGTTGVRAMDVDFSGAIVDMTYRELTQRGAMPH